MVRMVGPLCARAAGAGRSSSVRSDMFIVPCLTVPAELRRSGTVSVFAKGHDARRTDPRAAPTELGLRKARITINMALLTELCGSWCGRMAVHFSAAIFLTCLLNARREFPRAGVGQKFGTPWKASLPLWGFMFGTRWN